MSETVIISKAKYKLLEVHKEISMELMERLLDISKKSEKLIDGFKKWMDKNPARTTVLTIEGIQEIGNIEFSDRYISLLDELDEARKAYSQELSEQEALGFKEKRDKEIAEREKLISEFREQSLNASITEMRKPLKKLTDSRKFEWHGSDVTLVNFAIGQPTTWRLLKYGVKTPADLANYTLEELTEAIKKTPQSPSNKSAVKALAKVYGITLKG
jgi:sRNA-binding regulator protein Hfq